MRNLEGTYFCEILSSQIKHCAETKVEPIVHTRTVDVKTVNDVTADIKASNPVNNVISRAPYNRAPAPTPARDPGLKYGRRVETVKDNSNLVVNADFKNYLNQLQNVFDTVISAVSNNKAPAPAYAPARAPNSAPKFAPKPAPKNAPKTVPKYAPVLIPTPAPTPAPTSAPAPAPIRAPEPKQGRRVDKDNSNIGANVDFENYRSHLQNFYLEKVLQLDVIEMFG